MKYLLLNNQYVFQNIEKGIVEKKHNNEIEKLPSLNYLIQCTNTIIKIDINLEETNIFFKATENIPFQYQNKSKTLLKDTILDECYVDFLEIDKSKMLKLKIAKENNIKQEEEIKKDIVKKRGKSQMI